MSDAGRRRGRHPTWAALAFALAFGWAVPGFPSESPAVRLEAEFVPAEVEVQAQAALVLRLFQAISIDDPQWRPPAFRLADIRELGEPRRFEAGEGGRRYRVTERRYAVFPYASGALAAEDVYVEAGLFSPERGGFVRRRIEAPVATLAVRPLPEQASGGWLPARSLVVSEHWEAPQDPGAGHRRTIRVEAQGVDAARIVVPVVAGEGFSATLQGGRRENRVEGDWNIGIVETDWLIVPRKHGPFEVPSWHIDWWDATAQQARRAVLPPRLVGRGGYAPPESGASAQPGPASELTAGLDAPSKPGAHAEADAMAIRDRDQFSGNDPAAGGLYWLAAALVCLLATGAAIGHRWRVWAGWYSLRRACRDNDAPAAVNALRRLKWAAPRSTGALTPAAAARRCVDPALRSELWALDRVCYGPFQPWKGAALWRLRFRLRRLAGGGRPSGKRLVAGRWFG